MEIYWLHKNMRRGLSWLREGDMLYVWVGPWCFLFGERKRKDPSQRKFRLWP